MVFDTYFRRSKRIEVAEGNRIAKIFVIQEVYKNNFKEELNLHKKCCKGHERNPKTYEKNRPGEDFKVTFLRIFTLPL